MVPLTAACLLVYRFFYVDCGVLVYLFTSTGLENHMNFKLLLNVNYNEDHVNVSVISCCIVNQFIYYIHIWT